MASVISGWYIFIFIFKGGTGYCWSIDCPHGEWWVLAGWTPEHHTTVEKGYDSPLLYISIGEVRVKKVGTEKR